MTKRLEGKVALITGGGTGLGAELTKRYIQEGAKVVITGRRREVLEKMLEELPEGSAYAVAGDISKQEDAKAMVEGTVEHFGRIDILLNNAGIDPPGKVVELPVEQWQQIIDINLTGPFLLMKAAIPHMIEQGGGSIVNISSLAALRSIPAMSAYTSAKSGLMGLSQSVAFDYGPDKIRSNTICPGPIRTNMIEQAMTPLANKLGTDVEGALNFLTRFAPLRRVAETDDITGAAVYLGSEESAYMTGTVMTLDGGACIVSPNGASVASAGASWGQ